MNTSETLSAPNKTIPMRNVYLHVTRACNLRCAYCYLAAGSASEQELSAAEMMKLWPQMVRVGPQKVVFTGGEPLSRPDLHALMAGLKQADPEHKVLRCLNTNGWLLNRESAAALVGLADEVRVSVDSLRTANNTLRGEGSFEAAVRALQVLHSADLESVAVVTVSRTTLAGLEDLLAFLVERRITRIRLNLFRAIGRGAAHAGWQVTTEEARNALERAWKRIFPQLEQPEAPMRDCLNCGVGGFLNILPEGDVYPCHVLTAPEFRLGNVRERSLEELCAAEGRLAQLQALDFRALAAFEPAWRPLAQAGSCLGVVHQQVHRTLRVGAG